MKEIQMVDLKGQYQRLKQPIDSAIASVLESTNFIRGKQVDIFERELAQYVRAKHVISCANGTDALQIALMALGLQPGDEVITTGFTFIATPEVVELLGLKLVLADVDPNTFNISPQSIEKAITPKTKVIVPVHLFGQVADMEAIMGIARRNNLFVVEDAAQAINAGYCSIDGIVRKAGTIGHIGTTSFFPSKNLGCYGDGGALFTNDEDLAKRLRAITNHGSEQKYYHDYVGVNSRLDTIQAAVLRVKLPYLLSFNRARQDAAVFYDKELRSIPQVSIPSRDMHSEHVFHQYTIKVPADRRDALKEYLAEYKIPSMIYYPVPMFKQKAFLHYGYKAEDYPVSTRLCDVVLSLPMHTELDDTQLKFITDKIKDFFAK